MAKNIPFVIQIFLIMFLVMLVPCITLMLYSNHSIMRYSDEEIAQAALANIEASRRLNESILLRVFGSILRFVENQDFVGYGSLLKYASIQGNIDNGLKLRNIQHELQAIVKNDNAIYSIFLLFDNADYVISSDRGIVELIDYYSLTWMRAVAAQHKGSGGVWVSRELRSATLRDISVGNDKEKSIPALSYLYFLNFLTTSVRGTIAVNVAESFITDSLNHTRGADGIYGTMLIHRDGTVISHPDRAKVLAQARNFPHIAEILDAEEPSGYVFFKDSLYTWLTSDIFGWVYISVQSLENLTRRASRTSRGMIILTALALFAGAVASVGFLSWISRPMRRFVTTLREDFALKNTGIKNEMEFLAMAFCQIKEKETELHRVLSDREKDAALLAVRAALSGDMIGKQELERVGQLFPNPVFIVAVTAIDTYRTYRYRTNTELRAYHRYCFLNTAESLCEAPLYLRGVPYGDGQIAMVFNVPERDGLNTVLDMLESLRGKAVSIFETTVTIGVSDPGSGIRDLHNQANRAAEAVLTRMIKGNNAVYRSEASYERPRFFYPQHGESKILNYLDRKNLPNIEAELDDLQRKIRDTPHISNDNIRFIYNQLVGATAKHLTETEGNLSRFFSHQNDIYAAISSCDTLDEISALMGGFYRDILEYLDQDTPESQDLPSKILRYFEAHFREETLFDDIATELGISYSYMRKVVRETTGKSILDNINLLRIKEAKYLLLNTEKNAAEIAQAVGYRNIQSLNRYFKKYEGLTFSEYRIARKAER
ncbi:MAG: AraC family transcriptional regulator [Spirochaetaceae bacterium]|nr:AraC family transcriptional regulator [Spirochaetaceae bacterium]